MLESKQMGVRQKDSAGKILGWSIGTGMPKQSLAELLKLPCIYDFKAVGVARDNFLDALLSRVGDSLGRKIDNNEYSIKHSSKGNYLSITLRLYVESVEQIYAVYAAIKSDKDVKYVL